MSDNHTEADARLLAAIKIATIELAQTSDRVRAELKKTFGLNDIAAQLAIGVAFMFGRDYSEKLLAGDSFEDCLELDTMILDAIREVRESQQT